MALFRARALFCRCFSTSASHPTHICVVGSGPAGFYTAEKVRFLFVYYVLEIMIY